MVDESQMDMAETQEAVIWYSSQRRVRHRRMNYYPSPIRPIVSLLTYVSIYDPSCTTLSFFQS